MTIGLHRLVSLRGSPARRDCLDVFAASTRQGDVTRRAVEEANAKTPLETGNGIAGIRREVMQFFGRTMQF
jgi:hypothetical protein